MRLLVCGSRSWLDWATIDGQLSALLGKDGSPGVVIHGAAHGADKMAGTVALALGATGEPYPVDQPLDGPWPSAGPRRNARMLRDSHPTHGLAFGALWRSEHRVTGTGDMVRRMLRVGLPVRWVSAPGAGAVDLTEMPSPE